MKGLGFLERHGFQNLDSLDGFFKRGRAVVVFGWPILKLLNGAFVVQ